MIRPPDLPGESLLLHACCGPCATSSVERLLAADRRVTLFYSNANIAPAAEWEKRLENLRRVAEHFQVPLLVDETDHEDWLRAVRGLEGEPEGGARCRPCFRYSLERTARAAREGGFRGFASTLTVSPHKKSALIFEIGAAWESFEAWNFKKKDGYRRSLELSRRLELYRQDYCGCEFSRVESRKRRADRMSLQTNRLTSY